ncbi:MAG: family lipolytic protein [Nocardioides sp.]|nr:family lipolytic protein [Nocardioides sp.]
MLGDSIGWGQGATRADDRLAPRLVAALAQRGHDATTWVAAVPGARSRGLAAQVDAVLDWRPHVAVVVIGANDLTHLEPLDAAVDALRHAVRRLRAVGVEVVVAPAPDLSAVPHVPVFLRDVVRAAGERLRLEQARAVVAEGGLVADRDQVASRAFAADATLFSADRFHPSSRGYAVIADALLPTVLDAVRAVENAS